ncbi:hypothetical protein pb186bvf_010539 [Paramecium bursaria]
MQEIFSQNYREKEFAHNLLQIGVMITILCRLFAKILIEQLLDMNDFRSWGDMQQLKIKQWDFAVLENEIDLKNPTKRNVIIFLNPW